MHGWAAGSLLRHRTFGRGVVVAVEPSALHIFFPEQDSRFATKLRWPAARPFLVEDQESPDPWLSGLTSFALDRASGRYSLAANFVSQDQAVAAFVADQPDAFTEGSERGALWRGAGEAWARVTADGKAAALLEEGEYEQLARRLLGVATSVGNVPGLPTAAGWKEALAPGEELRPFLEALFGYLSVPSPARTRFDALSAAVQGLGAPADVAWGIATFFPFVAMPDRHVLLLPASAGSGAARLGTDLHLQPHPTWDAYGRVRKLSTRLLEVLRPHGARDHADVELFLHATGTRRAAAAPRARTSKPATRRTRKKGS